MKLLYFYKRLDYMGVWLNVKMRGLLVPLNIVSCWTLETDWTLWVWVLWLLLMYSYEVYMCSNFVAFTYEMSVSANYRGPDSRLQ